MGGPGCPSTCYEAISNEDENRAQLKTDEAWEYSNVVATNVWRVVHRLIFVDFCLPQLPAETHVKQLVVVHHGITAI